MMTTAATTSMSSNSTGMANRGLHTQNHDHSMWFVSLRTRKIKNRRVGNPIRILFLFLYIY